MSRHQQLYSDLNLENGTTPVVTKDDEEEENAPELVTRWKLDLTEGNERQRRRLLPNYEFDSLYNVDETADQDALAAEADQDIDEEEDATYGVEAEGNKSRRQSMHADGNETRRQSDFFVGESGMEATTALLKELNLKAVNRKEEDDDYFDDADDENQTQATTATGSSLNDSERMSKEDSAGTHGKFDDAGSATDGAESEDHHEADNASSYELITGLLQAGDWPEESYNVQRCTGLEVRKALLLWCRGAIYVIDGFEQTDGEGLEGKITRVEKEQSSYNINLRPKDFKVSEDGIDELAAGSTHSEGGEKIEGKNKASKKPAHDSSNEVTYQHKSQRIAFSDLHSVFRRRYQLQQIALEFYDIHSNGTLISFANHSEREEILSKVLGSTLPNSIFSSSYGTSINYKKFMSSLKSKIVSQWQNGKLTNFEFLMHLNSFAGRTYNDLTQYPVFPWVIADYDSEEIDLDDPKTYRDLSKPMGALSEERAQQFRDRYEALEANYFNDDETPPFHYGTHYSCAAYVLYYLMRLEPFSRLALTLQGGRFDVADRLFHNVGSSWKSASVENLQDVRELIPEFYYLPDFLTNTNHFDFGTTQKGKTVHDVSLPKWAKGDPNRFIRINRQALESDYVSRNLHKWIDLVFGYKQRGEEAVRELNTFVHVTYEGEVDLDAMTDPVQRESTIAQIQHFGQTPSRLERKPFPQRFVYQSLKNENIDFGSLPYLAPLTPPFCVVGAEQRCQVKRTLSDTCKLGITGQADKAVGDMCLVKGQLIGVARMCALNIPQKKYYRYGGPNNGLSVHVASTTARNRELNKMLSIHDGLHRSEISVARASLDGQWLVTGCVDSTVRVWKYENQAVHLCATLCGHGGWKITCLDVSTEFGTIATGCAHGTVLLWDLRTLTFVRRLRHSFKDESDIPSGMIRPTSSLSINHKNGNIVTLVGSHLSIFDINGNLLGTENSLGARPSCAVATDCPEWMEQGIVAVTGHINGEVRFWSLNYDDKELTVRHLMVDREHTCEITTLRVTGVDRQDTLLMGDKSGKMSVCKTVQLENLNQKELTEVVSELRINQINSGSIRSLLPGQSSVSDTENAF
jgi:WD40 repeat protein